MNNLDNTPDGTSGYHDTYWTDSSERPMYPALESDLQTEVVIVGAGIAGLSIAYCLLKAGRQVIVLEDGFIGSGETGRTTAHLVNVLDDRYSEIEKTFGADTARLAAESHFAAIGFIENIIKTENIDCDFQRVSGYLFLHPNDESTTLEDELSAAAKAGIRVEMLSAAPNLASYSGQCLHFPEQAQFHPMKYLAGLAGAVIRLGGRIFCNTHADEVSSDGVDANGYHISAQKIVVATNSPVNNLLTMHTKQHAYRTYVIAAEIPKGSLPAALWWDTGDPKSKWVSKPYHYVRTQSFNEESDLLIVGGEDHKTGQSQKDDLREEDRYENLEKWARQHFPMITNVAYEWSGQVLEPVDMLAYIGRNPGDDNIFIATGDSGNGMTHGVIAGILITDLIMGRPNPWSDLYDPARVTFSTAPNFIREGTNMAAQYLEYFTGGDLKSLDELQPTQGAVIKTSLLKVAVYRDENSRLHAYSAVCPHLGCYVHWNNDEKSFDCPCHGSRFTCEGKVVNGPAIGDLKPVNLNEVWNKTESRSGS